MFSILLAIRDHLRLFAPSSNVKAIILGIFRHIINITVCFAVLRLQLPQRGLLRLSLRSTTAPDDDSALADYNSYLADLRRSDASQPSSEEQRR